MVYVLRMLLNLFPTRNKVQNLTQFQKKRKLDVTKRAREEGMFARLAIVAGWIVCLKNREHRSKPFMLEKRWLF